MSDFAPRGPLWEEINKIALLGTERAVWKAPAGESALQQALAALDADAPENALLGAAALVAQHGRAGTLSPISEEKIPPPCDAETQPVAPARAIEILALILDGAHIVHLPEWLHLAAKRNFRVPFDLLPALLRAGRGDTTVRASIAPVLGRRGVWLAAQNADWKWALQEGGGQSDISRAEEIWQTGAFHERLQLLRDLRARDAAQARQLLQSTWHEEAPDERAWFLDALRAHLSTNDEEFLENALDDKRKEVRNQAIELLANLPDSQFVARQIERLRPILQWQSGLKPKLVLNLPNADNKTLLKAWARDGIDAKSKTIASGPHGSLLLQLVAMVPPSHWLNEWNIAPQVLLKAIEKGEWKSALEQGFSEATVRFGDAQMAQALLEWQGRQQLEMEGPLWKVLSAAQLETMILARLGKKEPLNDSHPVLRALSGSNEMWSEKITRAVLGQVAQQIIKGNAAEVFQLQQLRVWAARVPPHGISEAISLFSDPRLSEAPQWHFRQNAVQNFVASLHFRAALLESFRE